MPLSHDWKPGNWRALRERGLLREWLGLQQWLALPDADRHSDDNHSLQAVALHVLSCERDDSVSPAGTEILPAQQRLQQIHRHLQQGEPLPAADADKLAEWRKVRRQLRKQVIAETKLIQLPLEQLRDAIPYLTAFFFLSGYLMVSSYLGHFGIRVSRFFSLWDYISSSIDGLRGLLISVFLSGSGVLLAFRRTRVRLLQQALGVHRGLGLLHWLVLLVGIAVVAWAWFHQQGWMMTAVLATAIHVLIFITPKFFAYLRKPMRAMFVAGFLTIYGVYIVNVITSSIDFASRPFGPSDTLYRVKFTEDEPAGQYRLLAGNSQWLFLQNEALTVKAVSIEQILSVEVIPERESLTEAVSGKAGQAFPESELPQSGLPESELQKPALPDTPAPN